MLRAATIALIAFAAICGQGLAVSTVFLADGGGSGRVRGCDLNWQWKIKDPSPDATVTESEIVQDGCLSITDFPPDESWPNANLPHEISDDRTDNTRWCSIKFSKEEINQQPVRLYQPDGNDVTKQAWGYCIDTRVVEETSAPTTEQTDSPTTSAPTGTDPEETDAPTTSSPTGTDLDPTSAPTTPTTGSAPSPGGDTETGTPTTSAPTTAAQASNVNVAAAVAIPLVIVFVAIAGFGFWKYRQINKAESGAAGSDYAKPKDEAKPQPDDGDAAEKGEAVEEINLNQVETVCTCTNKTEH